MTIEEALRTLEGKAAVLRYLAGSAAMNVEPPDATVLSGIEDISTEIEELTRAMKSVLDVEALAIEFE